MANVLSCLRKTKIYPNILQFYKITVCAIKSYKNSMMY